MRRLFSFAGAALLAASLAGCGGGGGGHGGGFALPPASTSTSTSTSTPASSLTLKLTINGAVTVADTGGQYAVEPGDRVEITPSQSADWVARNADVGAIGLRNPDITTTKWAAQIVNTKPEPTTYTITAKASGNPAVTEEVVLKVGAADARNGELKVWAANGTQQTLTLDFDTMTYAMMDPDGRYQSDSFAEDPAEAGTYVFHSTKVTAPVNTARFRLTDDAVVGSFPFASPDAADSYAVQPFVAAHALTGQADIGGMFTRLSILYGAGGRHSQVRATVISADGTTLQECHDVFLFELADCPTASLATYTVSPGTTPGSWDYVSVADPDDRSTFSVVRVGGEPVMLTAGLNAAGTERVFRIGILDRHTFPTSLARGGDTRGAWGTIALAESEWHSAFIQPDGSLGRFDDNLFSVSVWPPGVRATEHEFGAWAMQNDTLSVIGGVRGNNPYMQIGLI